ncbi:MAG: serine/threonine-protein kinase [Candidatus Sedimenticola sp. 6PFRAG1]
MVQAITCFDRQGISTIEQLNRTTIGKFQIQKLIGEGATASVYLAHDAFNGDKVAIKIANQGVFEDPVHGQRFRKMFMNEASLAGKLRHPHIATVLDAGSENSYQYIVMEYVPGDTLKAHCKPETLLPVDDILEIIFKCCNALDYAHQQGLIHRDIKPANLLFTEGTDVKISDFGTALMMDSDLTQIMDVVGTPNYMPPEQVNGGKVTIQSDIYSLGVVMYQLLSGKLPFQANNQFDLIHKITSEAPPALDSVRSGLPPEVAQIVSRCLEKNPSERYITCSDLATDIARVHEKLLPAQSSASDSQKFNTLKTLRFFNSFTDTELWEIIRISKWHRFSAGTILLNEGKIGGSLFILASGEARIMKNDKFLGLVETGHCFGEMAYISGQKKPRSASVISDTKVTVLKIKNEALQKASDPLQTKFNKELLHTMAQRLEKTSLMATVL